MHIFWQASELFASNWPIAQRGIFFAKKKGQMQTWSARAKCALCVCLRANIWDARPIRSTGRQQKTCIRPAVASSAVVSMNSNQVIERVYARFLDWRRLSYTCALYSECGMCQYWYTCWKFNLSKLITFVLIHWSHSNHTFKISKISSSGYLGHSGGYKLF